MNTESALKTMGRHRRRVGEDLMDTEFAKLRRRLVRQHTIKLWAHQALVTIGYIVVVATVVALMLSL